MRLGLSTKNNIEKIDVDSSASSRQKKQDGNYFDSFIGLDFFYDKRNQKFQTTDGFYSNYSLELPVLSETNTLTNSYRYKIFTELYENNISTLSLLLQSSNSLTGDDVKLSERLYIPGKRLRGFERGKVGPKDQDDFIGGNYITTINATSTVPKILENIQNVDLVMFAVSAKFNISFSSNMW